MTRQEIESLKASVSIREVIGRYVKLNRVGRRWMGLCPFHGDRHPSLSVNEEKGTFVCYACGEKGDVFAFVSKIEGIGFREAAEKLKMENGELKIQEKGDAEQLSIPGQPLPEENRRAGNETFLASLLPVGSGCPELTPSWLDFGVGQSPHLVPEGWKRMRNRLVFPLRDEQGALVGFAARRLSDENPEIPKYINSASGEGFRKSEFLYGLHEAKEAIRREDCVFLVEGYKDVLAMHAAGFRHTVGLCGTALCPGHVALLKRYASSVRVLLDADEAGRKAALSVVCALSEAGLEARRMELPEGEDPDSLFRRVGREAFVSFVESGTQAVAPTGEQVLLGRIRKGLRMLAEEEEPRKRMRLLNVLDDCLTELARCSVDAARPATMDWRWL